MKSTRRGPLSWWASLIAAAFLGFACGVAAVIVERLIRTFEA